MDLPIIFPLAFLAICAVFWVIFMLALVRQRQCRSWPRTTGKVESFGVSYDVVSMLYRYEVDGKAFTGSAISPLAFARYQQGVVVRRSAYVDRAGRLKFPPGDAVTVYYNPKNFSDAALQPGDLGARWRAIFISTALVIAGLVLTFRPEIIWQHLPALLPFLPILWMLVLWLILRWAWKWISRYTRSKNWSRVEGQILEAKLVYQSGNGDSSGGYRSRVEYAYTVDGRAYRSSQVTVLNVYSLGSQSSAQAQVDAWKAQPAVTVFYDPRSPWDAYLKRGSGSGMFFPIFFLAAWIALGCLLYSRLGLPR